MGNIRLHVDEAGTGAFAGPFVVCGLLAPTDWSIPGLNDSKKLTPKKRSELFDRIQDQAPFVKWFLAWKWPPTIDALGLGRAHKEAIKDIIDKARALEPECPILIDGVVRIRGVDHESIPKADALFPGVSAASILAKVERDRWMQTEGDSSYPIYDFIGNVGYGTPSHMKALEKYGPCSLHRFSYAPIKRYAEAARVRDIITP